MGMPFYADFVRASLRAQLAQRERAKAVREWLAREQPELVPDFDAQMAKVFGRGPDGARGRNA